jgi:hypothetical protein
MKKGKLTLCLLTLLQLELQVLLVRQLLQVQI